MEETSRNRKRKQLKKYKLLMLLFMFSTVILLAVCVFGVTKFKSASKENDNKSREIEVLQGEKESLSIEKSKLEQSKAELESTLEEESKLVDNMSGQIDKLVNYQPEESSENIQGDYANIHPEIQVNAEESGAGKKIVYLTFDDGPSDLTPQFLEVLRNYGVNATFFVTYQPGKEEIYKQMLADGNSIQVHTATHDYEGIYASVESYMNDFAQVYNFIYEVTGVKPVAFRFPGGSTTGYAKSIVHQVIKEMSGRGFKHYDWNCSVGDGSAAATKDSIIAKVQAESEGNSKVMMLAHDSGTKTETLAALPALIEYFQTNGYTFETIDANTSAGFAQFIKE